MKRAGIKVWVLTGDKIETAINVALSCNLLNEQMNKIIIDGKSEDSVVDSLNKAIFGVIIFLIFIYLIFIHSWKKIHWEIMH